MPLLIPFSTVGSTKLEPSPYWLSIGDLDGDAGAWLSVVDDNGNSYTAGKWYAFGDAAGILTKRDPLGEIIWESSPFNAKFSPQDMRISPFNDDIYISNTLEDYSYTYSSASVIQMTASSGSGFAPRGLSSSPFDTFDVFNTEFDIDNSGNIYMTARVRPVPSSTEEFSVIAKLNSFGALQWLKKIDDGRNNSFYAIRLRVDKSNGDIYLAGESFTSFSISSGVALKINSSGSLVWAKELYDSSFPVRTVGGALDSLNNFYITNYLAEDTQVITKLNSSGNVVWQRKISSGYVRQAATDSDNNLFVIMTSGMTYVDVLKFDIDGNLLWQIRISGAGEGLYSLQPSVSSVGDFFLPITNVSGLIANGLIKLPGDGSITGTFGPITISSASRAVSTYSKAWTNASHPLSTYSLTVSDLTAAFTNPNLSYQRINIR